ncbi:MAG TPA: serine hydrolase domain-containing protein [Blastocatellia bacterium]|nr:serine hydrolase domain-containing protein [Blastocatellia bacterium]
MSKRLLLLAAISFLLLPPILLPLTSQSAGLPKLKPTGADAIDQMFEAAVANKEIPGVVAAVVNKEQVLYLRAFGKQDAGKNIPMSKDTVFRVASMGKPVTSVAIMQLVEQGKLRLDDPASQYLPALKGREVIATFNEQDGTYTTRPAKQEMTIRHLLAHTSGFGYGFANATVAKLQEKTRKPPRDFPLLFDPGTKWQYSGSTGLLGDIVVKLTGQSLENYFQINILRPLRMNDTSFYLPEEKMARLVTTHRRADTGLVETPNPAKYTGTESGEGGLVSTAADYAAFVQMLLNEGTLHNTRFLKSATVRQMASNQIGSVMVGEMPAVIPNLSAAFPFGAGKDKFGLGFQITMTEGKAMNERSAGSYAWAGIFNTHFWVDPKRGIGVVFLTQDLPFYNATTMGVMKRFERLMYANLR